jgi:hypothetical protein
MVATVAPDTRCTLCGHREDQHDTEPDGSRPCRSIGHPKGVPCAECRRLVSAEHVQAVMALREADDESFEAAWAAYHVTLDHVRREIGPGWTAFFTDVHQSALASAVLTLRAQEPSQADVGEHLAAALLRVASPDPAGCLSADTLVWVAAWLREHTTATLRTHQAGADYTEHREYEVVGGWGVDGARDEADARRQVRQALAEYPTCGARAQWRIVRTWEDDAQYYGPWQPLDSEETPG